MAQFPASGFKGCGIGTFGVNLFVPGGVFCAFDRTGPSIAWMERHILMGSSFVIIVPALPC